MIFISLSPYVGVFRPNYSKNGTACAIRQMEIANIILSDM